MSAVAGRDISLSNSVYTYRVLHRQRACSAQSGEVQRLRIIKIVFLRGDFSFQRFSSREPRVRMFSRL